MQIAILVERLAQSLYPSQKRELLAEATKTEWRRPGPELRDLEIHGLTVRRGAYWRLTPFGFAFAAYLQRE